MEAGLVMEKSSNTRLIRIGATWFCSMNTSTAKPAAGSEPVIRQAGPRSRSNSWRMQSMIPTKAKHMLARVPGSISVPNYRVRLAQTADDVRRAQRLRFEVFNLELNEGLAESHFNGLDADTFDSVCDHLLIEESHTGEIVGTYRLQTGNVAAANHGYYSEREFDFNVYEPLRSQVIELGRACVDKAHRNFSVLHLLWRGIATYALERNARFLVGCSSLTSQ